VRDTRSLLRGVLTCSFIALSPVKAADLPHIGYVYPAGGQRGTTFEVTVGGQYLEKVNDVHVTGRGIRAEILEYIEPKRRQVSRLRREMNKRIAELQKSHKGGRFDQAEAEKQDEKLSELRKALRKVSRRDPKAQPNAQIAETVRLRITMPKDTALGDREIRLVTGSGVSNPLVFQVGQLPEITEPKPPGRGRPPPVELPPLPVLVNGQILPGEVDRLRFKARKGQQLVLDVRGRALVPYLADAVPGWFQAVLTIYDPEANEVAFADDFRFNPDPVLFYDVPENGEYILEIRDSIHRGREDFVYRIAVGELPYITSIFPLGVSSQASRPLAVTGRNLPSDRLGIDARGKAPGIHLTSVRSGSLVSNTVPFAVDTLPEVLASEPNDDLKNAQNVVLPLTVNGRIDEPDDWDVFRFTGRAGAQIVAEVYARRVGSPLDSVLKLTDDRGRVVQINDDKEDKGAGLTTHHADSYLTCRLPSNGTYFVHLGDMQNHGTQDHTYRLRISHQRPDFQLRVVPSAVSIPQGGTAPVTVHVLRKDGFEGEVRVSFKHRADELSLSGAIPADEDKVRLTLTASDDAPLGLATRRLVGLARIGGKTVRRDVVPSEDMMQAFLYRHLVPAKEFIIAITKPERISLEVDIPPDRSLKIPIGGSVRLVVRRTPHSGRGGHVRLELEDPPKGISMDPSGLARGKKKTLVVFHADDKEVKPGLRGNLILRGKVGQNRPRIVCRAPAIPFEIVE